METVTLVRVLGTVVCLTGIVLCWYIRRTRFEALSSDKAVSVANVTLTQSAFWKLLAFVGIVFVPLAAIGVANYRTLQGTHKGKPGLRPWRSSSHWGIRYIPGLI